MLPRALAPEMTRLGISTAMVLAAFSLAPVTAAADAGMCVTAEALFSTPLELVVAEQSAALGAPTAAPAAPDDDRDILWCSSPDDPRCSPACPAPQNAGFTILAFPAAGIPARPELGAPTCAPHEWASNDGHGRPGARQRVERPPQP